MEDATKAGEGADATITSSLIQEHAQLPEATTRACPPQVERMSVEGEAHKRDGSSQVSSVLLVADEARPLIPRTHSPSSADAPSAAGVRSEQVLLQNSMALQSENRMCGPTENDVVDRTTDSEVEHSEVEEAM